MAIKSGQLREKKDFQKLILEYLEKENNYIIRPAPEYHPGYAMDIGMLFSFLEDTQKEELDQLRKIYKDKTEETIVNYLNNEINKSYRGVLDVLKHGIEFDSGVKLLLMYRKPANTFNKDALDKYNKNILSVMEEVNHKPDERIDLVIFVNGIAVITFELKCNTTGQNYEDSIRQFKYERDPKTRLFKFKSGTIVNFAMDLHEVYMCTHLKCGSSYFLPFNKGSGEGIESGKGNPHNEDGLDVSYMWEDILKKDTVLYLIDKIIYLKKEKKEDELTGRIKISETIIFPRYHQFNAVRKIAVDIEENETSRNYLIEHSAGSGKTNTIAWLSHRLASLHNDKNEAIFDTICIITDRIVVDRQLQDAVLSLEHKEGLIKVMDDKCSSSDLADALNGNTKIIVTTIQKFMYIKELVDNLREKKFALIIDEAHSSTSGSAMESVSYNLSSYQLVAEEQELYEVENDEETTMQDQIEGEIRRSGKPDNVSMIAFTATPKYTTLQLFGTLNEEGKKTAFDLYSMKQAIEEGFILDVLDNYVTYKTYFQVNKVVDNDPELDSIAAKRKIVKYIELHDTNISQKVEIIVEHFRYNVMHELDGKAKAMVVTSSRQSAVKYKNAFVDYINENNYKGIQALVAFSGKVTLDGKEYTESVMNNMSEDKVVKAFDSDLYQVLLVANKYQTGFDQPKLCAMYVDKRLKGVNAVQTLSRLNRTYPGYNKKTFVLDFRNGYEDIQKAFAPYYTEIVLGETITPSAIRELERRISEYRFLDYYDIEEFNQLLYKEKRHSKDKEKMWALLDKSLRVINQNEELVKLEIRSEIRKFIRFYGFLIQATRFQDIDLHKKYNFLSYLIKEIEVGKISNDFDIADKITATNFKQIQTGEYSSEIESEPEINSPKPNEVRFEETVKEKLSKIVDDINLAYNKEFDFGVVTKSALQVRDILLKDSKLKDSAKSNSINDFRFAYFDAVEEALVKGYEQNADFFSILLNDEERNKQLMGVFVEDIYNSLKTVV
ncbi:type I restriction endonuclease subunit R [Facklamia miroungae]|uniref:Type I restriction enzyme, R subunit n=1 Tax=Facklamia miroungae TaxID=120956 RepID=A0A1G7REX8_9LACT|nr:DEAD/DEAH box helicase family protein [Facklamia miroungae]NKZ29438.1 type I restriction endonuclease subunit R [Facklamia miroungae]SDG09327.1 type I restriction enzyme, R subunit [Facklamia miroungae]